ncbi:MAG: hypothetical protein UY05_C0015G0003 [Candidatus Peregrinibacteria bacterium GW2011_GWA2_47_7]|nr:MAG: hypothetical protein UY05_C0015G0003 [Candidatus Peregrinibacteria bacterium GW2011_GWA2_47_7]
MSIFILQALYFMMPAYLANMAPVLFKWIPWGNKPLDGGARWHGKPLFGSHKTLRGLIAGICGGVAAIWLQRALNLIDLELIKYSALSPALLTLIGMCFGAGALLGDLIKSFFKRRLGIKDGGQWIPFDQLDFVFGALLAVSPFFIPPTPHLLVILIATPFLHFATNVIAYVLGLKKDWW